MTSREWILRELGLRNDFLAKCGRTKEEVRLKWTIICFYRVGGKSTPYIARLIGIDHSSVLYALRRAGKEIREKAIELLLKYNKEVGGMKMTELPPKIKKLGYIKVPDYKHSRFITKAIGL